MSRFQPSGPPGAARSRRFAAIATAAAVGAGSIVAFAAAPAAAAPRTVTDVTLAWGISAEMQAAPPFGGCNFLSAGESDGTQAGYQAQAGNVAIAKAGGTPTWATKCAMANGSVDQKVVWSGGTGTVDPTSGEATIAFTGKVSMNFYGGLVPFTIVDPVVTVDANGDGTLTGTVNGYAASQDDPNSKVPLPPVAGVVIADLSDVAVGAAGFTVTPDYAGVTYDVPAGKDGTPQNRTNPGWGAWPSSFVDYHYETGLTSYWYSSGGAADGKKAPAPITLTYATDGETVEPPAGGQVISATVPAATGPGEFLWSIDGDGQVDLGETVNQGTYLQATGALDPITVTDTRAGGLQWSVSGQVGDFTGGVSAAHLGWSPTVVTAGAGAVAGNDVAPGTAAGQGLSSPSVLAAGPSGHAAGTGSIGADLDLRLPAATAPGTYRATLTITALS